MKKIILLVLFCHSTFIQAQSVDSLEIVNVKINQFDSANVSPFYTSIPWNILAEIDFQCEVKNNTSDTVHGFYFDLSLVQLETVDGTIGRGSFFQRKDSSYAKFDLLSDSSLHFRLDSNAIDTLYCGKYELRFTINNIGSNYRDTISKLFYLTDSVMANDIDKFHSQIGPQSYLDTSINAPPNLFEFNAFGSLFYIEDISNGEPSSISFKVSTDTNNIGIDIAPIIWQVDTSKWYKSDVIDYLGGYIVDGPIYTVKAADTNTWITLPLSSGYAKLSSGYYVAGWEEIVSIRNRKGHEFFSVQNDTVKYEQAFDRPAFVYFDTTGNWIQVNARPAIRLNISGIPGPYSYNPFICWSQLVSSQKEILKSDIAAKPVSLYPNPCQRELQINLSIDEKLESFKLLNLLGQEELVKLEQKTEGYSINLNKLPNGIYILQLQLTNGEVISKKVIKQ